MAIQRTCITAPPRLRRQSLISFWTADIPGLGAWLEAHGFTPTSGRLAAEYARREAGGATIICYHSGSVVCAGTATDAAIALLERLVAP